MYIFALHTRREGKLLPEASHIRTDRKSIGKSCRHAGLFYLWIVVVAGGNSKLPVTAVQPRFISANLSLLCSFTWVPKVHTLCSQLRNRSRLVSREDTAPSHSLPVTHRKLPELKHISKCPDLWWIWASLCSSTVRPCSLAPSCSLRTPARCFGSHLDWATLTVGREGARKYVYPEVSVHVGFCWFPCSVQSCV